MALLFTLLACTFFICSIAGSPPSDRTFPYDAIRLPNTVAPVEYHVFLHPNITDGKFGYTGNVSIVLEVKKATDLIVLHSKDLTDLKTDLHEQVNAENKGKTIAVKETFLHVKHDMLMLRLAEKISTAKRYVLRIQFRGNLSGKLNGFYKSAYKTPNGKKKYLATTQFEATGARRAFPCFDEPAMKAKFSIIIVREKIHSALSNMPVVKSIARKDGLVADYFQKSVKMSTYLVAFVVSDFAYLSTTSKRGVKIRVWAPRHLIWQAKYAVDVTPKILDYYEQFFKVNFPLPKQDLIAIPDFSAGAMENWGLVTYRLTALLYDEKESSASNKQWVAAVIAHELAHQWFGNLVTMKWWNDLWLNEGFASFVSYYGTNLVNPGWQMMDQFVIGDVQNALTLDSKLNSHPVSVAVKNPADIGGLFDTISYSKGASIIRMMEDFIGASRFKNGLVRYLDTYKYGNAVSDDLWNSLSKATGSKIKVKTIMDTWTLQMGYPVVNVVRDPRNKGKAIITQERFVTDVQKNHTRQVSPFNYKWEIPLTFYFQHNRQEQRSWMHLHDESVSIPWDRKSGWLKVNMNQIGFYRVNYDKENWGALAAQLKRDHSRLSPADRSNLIDDAFELAEAGRLSQEQALTLTEYLVNEKMYLPFYTAISSLGHIGKLLKNRAGYKFYEKYIVQRIHRRVLVLGWKDTGSHLDKYLRSLVLRVAISHNLGIAVANATMKFKQWMTHGTRVPTNLRSIVYEAGIKHGGQKEWDFIFQKYKTSTHPSETRKLMNALAESRDPRILKRYLENSLNSDVVSTQDTDFVICRVARNPVGTKIAHAFILQNWHILYKRSRNGMARLGSIFRCAFGGSKTRTELGKAEHFLSNHKMDSGKRTAMQTIATIRNNINWLARNEEIVVNWLEKVTKKDV